MFRLMVHMQYDRAMDPFMAVNHFHGWFFHRMREYSLALSDAIHDAPTKPFAIAIAALGPAPVHDISVTMLTDALSAFGQALLEFGSFRAELGRVPSTITIERGSPEVNPALLLESARPASRLTFEFLTPTSFRRRGTQVLFPEPGLVFSGLARRWNDLYALQMPDLPEAWDQIRVSHFRLHTSVAQLAKHSIIGCMGKLTYTTPREFPPEVARQAAALAAFAEWAGLGYGTTKGFGTVAVKLSA